MQMEVPDFCKQVHLASLFWSTVAQIIKQKFKKKDASKTIITLCFSHF